MLCASRATKVRAPSAVIGTAVEANAATTRQSTSRHQTAVRDRLAISPAIAMTGTASLGPTAITSAGINMIDEPNPTMPPMVPAIRAKTRTAIQVIELPAQWSSIGS